VLHVLKFVVCRIFLKVEEKITDCAKNVTKIMHKFIWWGKNGRGRVGQRAEEAEARPTECEVLA
jgi:hypothetical protein